MEKPNIAVDLESHIRGEAAKSFLERATDKRKKDDDTLDRVNAVFEDYAKRTQFQDAVLGLVPTPGRVPKMSRPGAMALRPTIKNQKFLTTAEAAKKSIQQSAPKETPKPGPSASDSFYLSVVAPFLKKMRRESIKKDIDEGKIYDKTSRLDPDLTEVPGITDKVKQKRAEVIQDWNPEIQRLERYQAENIDDGISVGGRGGIFYTPNFDNSMYKRSFSNLTYGSEGGSSKIVKHKKTRNPLILKRDADEYVGEAGLSRLFGENINIHPSSDLSWAPKNLQGLMKNFIKKKPEKARVEEIFQERMLSEASRMAGYDSILGARVENRSPISKNKTVTEYQLDKPNPKYKKPIKANQFIELDNFQQKEKAIERSRGSKQQVGHLLSTTPMMKFYVEKAIKDFHLQDPKFDLVTGPVGEKLKQKANDPFFTEMVDNLTKHNNAKIPNVVHGPYSQLIPYYKENAPDINLYEQFLKEILQNRLLKYKKEHKP